MTRKFLLALWIAFCGTSLAPAADEWGTLTMRFVYDGELPKPQVIKPETKTEIAVCGKELPDERLLIHVKDRGVANVIVWLQSDAGDKVPIHPGYEKSAKAEVVIESSGCRFHPRVVLVRTGQSFVWQNKELVGHNFKADFSENEPFNILRAPSASAKFSFTKAEPSPALLTCGIHP